LGVCFLWVVFVKYTEVAQIIGLFFHVTSCVVIFTKNGLGYILGDFFHKLIWSPCLATTAPP
jgi:hypothetical protein